MKDASPSIPRYRRAFLAREPDNDPVHDEVGQIGNEVEPRIGGNSLVSCFPERCIVQEHRHEHRATSRQPVNFNIEIWPDGGPEGTDEGSSR